MVTITLDVENSPASVASKYPVEKAPTRKWVPKPLFNGNIDWRFLSSILEILHGNPRHGNPENPVDCLVYVMLTRKTPIEIGEVIFERLKERYRDWEQVIADDTDELRRILHGSGLEDNKAHDIQNTLSLIREKFGAVNLDRLKDWGKVRCLKYLTSLPGVGPKTARCVMMYALGKKVFPADAHCIRVLTRIGVIEEGLGHKKAQEILAGKVPDNVAYKLHVNLVAHGQKICTPENPGCESCTLDRMCEYYRALVREKSSKNNTKPTVIDLFSGAGGTSFGLTSAGYRIVAAVDNDFWACQTYILNHPEVPYENVVCEDIHKIKGTALEKIKGETTVDLVIGGPPCQGFSMIGKRIRGLTEEERFIDDPRNELYREFVRLVKKVNSRIVVMENVPGLFSLIDGHYRDQIKEDLNHGYAVEATKVNSKNIGVPQSRIRVFFIGASREAFHDKAQEITDGIIKRLTEYQDPGPDLRYVISDLPSLEQDDGKEVALCRIKSALSPYATAMVENNNGILFNHVSRPLNIRDRELYALLKPGETGNDAVEKHNRRDLMVYRTDVFRDKYRRLDYDRVAPTVVAHLCKDGHMFIHPDRKQNRSLTVREAARIQSFPDDFIFYGPRSYQFRHVGNAVPPLVAKKLGEIIRDVVSNAGFDW